MRDVQFLLRDSDGDIYAIGIWGGSGPVIMGIILRSAAIHMFLCLLLWRYQSQLFLFFCEKKGLPRGEMSSREELLIRAQKSFTFTRHRGHGDKVFRPHPWRLVAKARDLLRIGISPDTSRNLRPILHKKILLRGSVSVW